MHEKEHILRLLTHKNTGLKYLSYHYGTLKTNKNYLGSGKYWTAHLSKHGKTVSSTILYKTYNKNEIVEQGLYYSKLWSIVESKEFANLIEEDCNTTSSPLQRPDVRRKRNEAFKHRISTYGLTEKEKQRAKKACQIMQNKIIRKRAAASMTTTWADPTKNQKLLLACKQTSERKQRKQYTTAEITSFKNTSLRQTGKTMTERCGVDYIDPRSKPFNITLPSGKLQHFNRGLDFIKMYNLTTTHLLKLSKAGLYKFKRTNTSKHPFNTGDTILFKWV